jgi:hypothetical protein
MNVLLALLNAFRPEAENDLAVTHLKENTLG